MLLSLIGNQGLQSTGVEHVYNNVLRRMSTLKHESLASYLRQVMSDKREFNHFVSSMTIHHTHWFREMPHFDAIKKYLETNWQKHTQQPFRVLVAACSTGEEVYSLVMLLEGMACQHREFDYQIHGIDIDPLCIETASEAVYSALVIPEIPSRYRRFIELSKDKSCFRIKKNLRKKVSFATANLLGKAPFTQQPVDVIFCRNVMIYLSRPQQSFVVGRLLRSLQTGGLLVLGHSESLAADSEVLVAFDGTIYQKQPGDPSDQSAHETSMLKPNPNSSANVVESREPAKSEMLSFKQAVAKGEKLVLPRAILIGASTGGTEALANLLKDFPSRAPPVFVVQHMPKDYRMAFANRLSELSGLPLVSAFPAPLEPGRLYMTAEDKHLVILQKGGKFLADLAKADPFEGHRPAIENLFFSASQNDLQKFIGILLTGMGSDGARGLLALRQKGSLTMAQDEATSVVYGMPQKAAQLDGVDYMGNLGHIRLILNTLLKANQSEKKSA